MTLSNPAISIAFRWRFGLALVHDPSLRCACGKQIDREGDHFQRCMVGGHHVTRHHALRGATASLFRHVAVIQEERHASSIGTVHPEDAGLRLDIVADDGHTRSSTTYFMADVTITHPVSSNQAKLNRTSRIDGAAAQDAEANKQRTYSRASRSLAMPFFPIAVESFGRWGKSALWCIRDKAATLAINWEGKVNKRQKALILQRWWRTLSCVNAKMNSYLILQKLRLAVAHTATMRGGTPPAPINTNCWD
mmetsp:Transcript_3971/g.6792  ORF Transcript_3971/g.6792 Transcript_3971/m.6792 type:complete len:250 (+) Transcript_3971:150-899(+)